MKLALADISNVFVEKRYGTTSIRVFWLVALWTVVVLGLIAGIVLGINEAAYAGEKASCTGYGQTTHRAVKFPRYWLMSYECLVRDDQGRWISKDKLFSTHP